MSIYTLGGRAGVGGLYRCWVDVQVLGDHERKFSDIGGTGWDAKTLPVEACRRRSSGSCLRLEALRFFDKGR